MPELIAPHRRVHRSFAAAMAEFEDPDAGPIAYDNDTIQAIRAYGSRWGDPAEFDRYLGEIADETQEDAPVGDDRVAQTTLWWVDGDEYLGRVTIRHRLTAHLLEVGGHIGYDVRPSARRRGHATAMLAAALPAARSLGIDPALVTCDADNVGSRKVIEANGGVLEDRRGIKLRYWVPTS